MPANNFAPMPAATICAYSLPDGSKIERVGQITGPCLWAVRNCGSCLNNEGEFEYEPMPSSRTEDFIKRCRFESAESAYKAWEASNFAGHLKQ